MRYVKFHGAKTHPKEMGKTQVEAFLSHLATQGKVAAATQCQALNAIVFLYRDVLLKPIEGQIAPIRAKRHPRVPVVMTQAEVTRVLSFMSRTRLLMARLLYGSGLRLMACVRLRVQDLDFTQNLIYVRGAKGGKDRVSLFPQKPACRFDQASAMGVFHNLMKLIHDVNTLGLNKICGTKVW